MLYFQLFRIRVYFPAQMDMFTTPPPPRPELIEEVILSKPFGEVRKETFYKIGNVFKLNAEGIYFKIAKKTVTTVDVEKHGDFFEEELETFPNTHVIVDFRNELCAIAKKTTVAQRTQTIANYLAKLLSMTEIAQEYKATFEIKAIPDPEDFLYYVKHAYKIIKVEIELSRPNTIDEYKDIFKPYRDTIEDLEADEGKSSFKGKNLSKDTIEKFTYSATPTGEEVAITAQMQRDEPFVKKRLRHKVTVIPQEDDLSDDEARTKLFDKIRDIFSKVNEKIK